MKSHVDGRSGFEPRRYLPRDLYEAITDLRVRQPALVEEEASRRARRAVPAPDGRLVILGVGRPGGIGLGGSQGSRGLADRHEILAAVIRVLSYPGVDGVASTPDLLEDLLALSALLRERGRTGLLDERVLLGCLNRGRVPGAAREIEDDLFTAFTSRRLAILRMDGGMVTVRTDPGDPRSPAALEASARAVSDLAEAGLLVLVEPLPAPRDGQEAVPALLGAVRMASALGSSSLATWLVMSAGAGFERAVGATTLPCVIRGEEALDDPRVLLAGLRAMMRAGRNVRGALIGPGVLESEGEDPRAIAAAIASIVHDEASPETAVAVMHSERARDLELV